MRRVEVIGYLLVAVAWLLLLDEALRKREPEGIIALGRLSLVLILLYVIRV